VTADESGYHLSSEEFRRRGYELVDWIAGYLDGIEAHRVMSPVEPGWVRSQLPAAPPEQGEPWEAVLADLDRVVVPGLTHWQHPSFFAFFPANSSGPSVLGELASAGLGVQGMLWATSPACTEIETHVLDWMIDLCGLPEGFRSSGRGGGAIQDSASSAALVALLAARDAKRTGDEVAYVSTQAHSSLEKGVRVARIPHLRSIAVDERFALRTDELEKAVAADREAGLTPAFVASTIGTTSSLAVDPVAEIGAVARREGMWHHVDGAMAGSAAVVPELRWVNDGLDTADSYCFNPHKWLFTNFDCTAFFVTDRRPLLESLSILPEYLRNEASESGAVIDYRDWQVPLGRRFRALKLWFVLRHYGAEGLRHHVREHVRLAQGLAERIDADPRFEVVAPVRLSLICFRHVDGDEATDALLQAVNRDGRAYLTPTKLDGRSVIRVSVAGTRTEERHVDALWSLLDELAA
jgi:aromatic-L-amino-acid/L-tryptophan decarboxylase